MAIPELQHAFLRSLAFPGSPFLCGAEPSSPGASRGARPRVGIRRLRARALAAEHFSMCWSEFIKSEGNGEMGGGLFSRFIRGYFPFLSLLVLHRALQQLLREQVWVTKTKGSEQGMCAGILASCTTWGDLVCQTEKSPTPVKWQEYLSSIGGGKILTASKAVMLLSAQIYTSCQD